MHKVSNLGIFGADNLLGIGFLQIYICVEKVSLTILKQPFSYPRRMYVCMCVLTGNKVKFTRVVELTVA